MRKAAVVFLKVLTIAFSLLVLTIAILAGMDLCKAPINTNYASFVYPMIAGIYLSLIPLACVLYNGFNILRALGKKEIYDNKFLKNIIRVKIFSLVITAIYVVILPFVFLLADKDDAPGLILVGGLPIIVSMVIAAISIIYYDCIKTYFNTKNN